MKDLKYCLIPVVRREERCYLNGTYIKFIHNNGYIPVPIMITEHDQWQSNYELIGELPLDQLCCLMPGGLDIEPTIFGFNNSGSVDTKPWVDRNEYTLIEYCVGNSIPIFGICRGLQLFFISILGSDILWWQDISGHRQVQRNGTKHHSVEKKTKLLDKYDTKWLNRHGLFVNSYHHQAIELSSAPKNYDVSVHATINKARKNNNSAELIEAASVHDKDGKMVFAGVQWHPEELDDQTDIMKHMFKELGV